MGYGQQAATSSQHLREMLILAIVKQITPLVGTGGANGPLADAIAMNPQPAIEALYHKVQAVDGVTVESTDAEIDTAVLAAQSVTLLKKRYGL